MKLAKTESIYKPNLLINGDFKVWPRGESFTIQPSQTNKTAAMWQLQNQRETAAQIFHQTTDEGKGTGFGFPGLSSMRIYQWLPIEVMKPYEGKKMTRIWSVNKQVSKEEFTLDLTENINGDYWRAFYYLSSSNDVLNFAGLYEGSVDTHFIEDDAIALTRCMEYVQVIKAPAKCPIGFGVFISETEFYGFIPLPIPLKSAPNIIGEPMMVFMPTAHSQQWLGNKTCEVASNGLVVKAAISGGASFADTGTIMNYNEPINITLSCEP